MTESYIDVDNDGITRETKKKPLVRNFEKISKLEEGILVWSIKDGLSKVRKYIEKRLNEMEYDLTGFENSGHNEVYGHFYFKKRETLS